MVFRRRAFVYALGALALACTAGESDYRRRTDAGLTSGAAGVGEGDAGEPGGAGAAASGNGGAGHASAGASGAAGQGTAGASGGAGARAGAGASGSAGAPASGTAGANGSAGASGRAGASGSAGAGDAGVPSLVYSGFGGIENLLINTCGGCHYASPGVNVQGGFAFSYADMIGTVTSANKACVNLDASKRRVVPGKPDNSLLYIKIFFDKPPSGCGGHMPNADARVNDTNLAIIRQWILDGAKEM